MVHSISYCMIKKIISFTSTLFVILSSISGQPHNGFRNEDYDIHKFRVIKIKIAGPQKHVALRNFSSVIVVDARPDTIPVGFMQKHVLNHAFVELDKSVKLETESFVKEYLQFGKNDSSGGVLMVLKKLWLSDELNLAEDQYINDKIRDKEKNYTSGIKIKVEFYYKRQNDYYPLYRYDSILTDSFNVSQNGPRYIHDAIIASLSKLISIDDEPGNMTGRRKLNWEEIKRHNEESFDMLLLKDTSLQRGVYATFEEFKNNRPSQKDFEVRNDKMNDILYIRQPDGKELVTRDNWGYCDGNKSFIRSADNFFELQRMGNTFYIYGAKTLNRTHPVFSREGQLPWIPPTTPNAPGAMLSQINHRHLKLILEPLQLDWDTGKLD